MVLVKVLMEIALPKMGELLVMMMTIISPSEREVPPAELLRRRAKVLLPKFRLETAALRTESLLIFSRSESLLYQKMGTGGGPKRPQPTRVRQGGLTRPGGLCPPRAAPGPPRWVVPTWWPPLVLIRSNISYIFHKKSPWSFSSFEVVQNRWPDVAFLGPDFQLPEFSLLVCTLQIMRGKALELLQKALLWIKTL